MVKKDIKRYSLAEIKAMNKKGDVVATAKNAPLLELDEQFWKHARVIVPSHGRKSSVHLRVDPEVLDFFRGQGKGHLTRMAAVLKAFVVTRVRAE